MSSRAGHAIAAPGYSALGKPIRAGVSGYVSRLLRGEMLNAVDFQACVAGAAVEALGRLRLSHTTRQAFVAKVTRK